MKTSKTPDQVILFVLQEYADVAAVLRESSRAA